MICTRCLLFPRSSHLSISSLLPQHLAQKTKTSRRLASSTTTTTTIANPATSTSAAQPFSTPLTPSPARSAEPIPTSTSRQRTQPLVARSTMKAGTPLKGLNFVKGKEMPLAREDGEYPDWLWGLLEAGKFGVGAGGKAGAGGGGAAGGDLFSKSAKQRKLAARAARRSASASTSSTSPEDLAPEIPIYEQSVDLPAVEEGWRGIHSPPPPSPLQPGEKGVIGGKGVGVMGMGRGGVDGKTAREAREGLTKSLRTQRRKGIKEANFLRGMR